MDVEWSDKFSSLINKGLIEEISGNKVRINNKSRKNKFNKVSKTLTKTVNALYREQYRKENKPERRIKKTTKINQLIVLKYF